MIVGGCDEALPILSTDLRRPATHAMKAVGKEALFLTSSAIPSHLARVHLCSF